MDDLFAESRLISEVEQTPGEPAAHRAACNPNGIVAIRPLRCVT